MVALTLAMGATVALTAVAKEVLPKLEQRSQQTGRSSPPHAYRFTVEKALLGRNRDTDSAATCLILRRTSERNSCAISGNVNVTVSRWRVITTRKRAKPYGDTSADANCFRSYAATRCRLSSFRHHRGDQAVSQRSALIPQISLLTLYISELEGSSFSSLPS